MESVDKTLSSTQHLLEAIEQDDALLDDEYFLRKLEYLRMKHKETSEFLARIIHQQDCLPPSISTCTCSGRNCSIPSEWSFSGSVSAKLVTKNGKKNRSQSSTSAARRKQQEVARTAMEAYTSLERKIEEKRERLYQEKKLSREKITKEKSRRDKTISKGKQEREERHSEKQALKHSGQSTVVINFPQEIEVEVENEESNGNEESPSGSSKRSDSKDAAVTEEYKVEEEAEAKEEYDANKQSHSRTKETIAEKPTEQLRPKPSIPPRSKSMTVIGVSQKLNPALTSTSKREIVPQPIQNFVPQITIPRPFRASTRKPIPNTYSTKFVEEMISKRKQEEELESQASTSKPFTAHGVPLSTYIPTNPRVLDKTYVEAIRKRLTANLRKHFEEEAILRKTKSMGDISALARPVPLSTYVPPTQLPDYRRARSAGRRSVKLLVDAKAPALNNEHAIRSNVSTKVRHILCVEGSKEQKYPRPPVPNFKRLHAEMEEKLKNAPHKSVTVPKPFKLSNPDEHKHRQCKSTSPPRHRPKSVNKTTKEVIVRSTHSSEIRKKAIRQRELKMYEEQHKSEKFWEEKKEEMSLSRMRLLSSMGSYGNIQEEIDRKAAEKRRHIKETTKDYERYLAEMQQRVIDRPLIMEQQSIIAQKDRLSRKFAERMAEAELMAQSSHKTSKTVKQRKDSDISAGTYSVKSKSERVVGDEDYPDVTIESEGEEPEARRASSASSTSSSSSSSPSSSATSTSDSDSDSKSSSLSHSSRSGSQPSGGRQNSFD